jgi:hypothetical protein
MNTTIKELGGLEYVKGDPVTIGSDTANKGSLQIAVCYSFQCLGLY